MKIGGLVECMKPTLSRSATASGPSPVVGYRYIVNWIGFDCGVLFIGVEELHQNDCVAGELFREIEFPPALTESIQECLTRELEVVK